MSAPSALDQIAERVERLLLRHDEVQRTNELLQDQVAALQSERDLLKSRLSAARSRIDVLLDQLSPPEATGASAALGTSHTASNGNSQHSAP